MRKKITGFTSQAIHTIKTYSWPGNVRELENLVERIAILCDSDSIEPSQLPDHIHEVRARVSRSFDDITLPPVGVDFNALIEEYENRLISTALNQTGGNKKAAARLLGLNSTTLVEKIKKKGLEGKIEVSVVSDDVSV